MQLIPVSSPTDIYRRVYFTAVDAADLQIRLTGLSSGVFICKLSKNGAAAVAATNSVVEVDAVDQPGVYYLELTAAECDTLGQLVITIISTVF